MDSREKGRFITSLISSINADCKFRLPEQDLLATVLAYGISEAAGYNLGNSRTSYKKHIIRQSEAKDWVDSDDIFIDEKKGISFAYICEALSLNHNLIRSALNNGKISGSFVTHFRNREQKGRNKLQ